MPISCIFEPFVAFPEWFLKRHLTHFVLFHCRILFYYWSLTYFRLAQREYGQLFAALLYFKNLRWHRPHIQLRTNIDRRVVVSDWSSSFCHFRSPICHSTIFTPVFYPWHRDTNFYLLSSIFCSLTRCRCWVLVFILHWIFSSLF